MDAEPRQVTTDEFLESIVGQSIECVRIEDFDLFLEFSDGRVLMLTVVNGPGVIAMCQVSTDTLQ